ncbi:PAS domain-containing protein [Thermodesulfobacteriota bacterium]
MNSKNFLNNLLTSGIELSDPDTIRRIKTLNTILIFFILAAICTGLFFLYIGADLLFSSSGLAALLLIPGILILRKTKNMVFVGNYAILIVWIALFFISWNTGAITFEGVIQPSWILNAGLILLAIFLNGYLSGTVWTTLTFLQIGLVIYLYRDGYQFNSLIPPDISDKYSMASYMLALLGILLFAFLFEKEKSEALTREQEKSYALRESKRYLDDIFDRSPLPSFIIDKSHRVIQWNHACRELTGIPSNEILGQEIWEGFKLNNHGSIADVIIDEPDKVAENFRDSIVSQTDDGWLELNIFLPKMKEGSQAIITAAPILDNAGVVRGAIQTVQEIPSSPAENEGGETSCLHESFPNPVFKLDAQGNLNFWNKACETIFGYNSSKMIGSNPQSMVSERYRSIFQKTIDKVFEGKSFTNLELRYQTEEGKPVYVLARAFPNEAVNGEERECVIENIDITELKIKLNKLNYYASESKKKLQNLSEEHELLKKNIAAFIRKKEDNT